MMAHKWKKWLVWATVLLLLCGTMACKPKEQATAPAETEAPAAAETEPAAEPAAYKLGDKMDDFTATLLDGTEVTLYGLLAEKKAVLLNFWATWCGPCRNEFPYMQQAYDEMSDDIAVLAMSTEPTDTAEVIADFKKEMGLDTLPLLQDNGVSQRFSFDGIPTSVLIDRNGVVCFIETGSLPDKGMFTRLFSAYVGDDYDEPVLLSEIPAAMPTEGQPEAEIMLAALQIADENITVAPLTNAAIWPFLPAEDGSCLEAGNSRSLNNKGTNAQLTLQVNAQAGDALAFERQTNFTAVLSTLAVDVDGVPAAAYGGEHDWTMDYVRFETAGTHTVTFTHNFGIYADDKLGAKLRGVRLVAASDLPALQATLPKAPDKSLPGETLDIELISGKAKPAMMDTMTTSLRTSPAYILEAGEEELTFRIRLGQDVNEKLAVLEQAELDSTNGAINDQIMMLNELPRDEQGYLYTYRLSDGFSPEGTMGILQVWSSASADASTDGYANIYVCYTVAAMDDYTKTFNDSLQESEGPEQFCTWRYADEEAPAVAAAQGEKSGQYVITVVDEQGKPVEGVTLQICDASTCQMSNTDKDGKVVHTGAPYAYEIHVLKAPDGYAKDTEIYVMPLEGGELTIRLKKA